MYFHQPGRTWKWQETMHKYRTNIQMSYLRCRHRPSGIIILGGGGSSSSSSINIKIKHHRIFNKPKSSIHFGVCFLHSSKVVFFDSACDGSTMLPPSGPQSSNNKDEWMTITIRLGFHVGFTGCKPWELCTTWRWSIHVFGRPSYYPLSIVYEMQVGSRQGVTAWLYMVLL